MRPRQDALTVGAMLAALGALPGCGAVFHSSQNVAFVTPPADRAAVYEGGVPVAKGDTPGTYTKPVFLNNVGGHVAAAPGKKIANVTPERHVDGLAIACDVLWSLTIIGIAAPISDALLGTFVKTEPNVRVKLEPDEAIAATNPMPVYSLGTTTLAATPENADTAPAAQLGGRQSLDEAAGAQAEGLSVAPTCAASKPGGQAASTVSAGVEALGATGPSPDDEQAGASATPDARQRASHRFGM